MTVGEMCERMPLGELFKWHVFMERKAAAERGESDPMTMDGDDFGAAFGAR